ncbi:hypothetical protein GCM10009081_00440 [Brevundimonas nasdae]
MLAAFDGASADWAMAGAAKARARLLTETANAVRRFDMIEVSPGKKRPL